MAAEQHVVATCFGGGALWGIGWGLGVARTLEDVGEDLSGAPALGCSAGAWVAAAVAQRVPTARIVAIPLAPELVPGALVAHARDAFGDSDAPSVRVVVAIDGDVTPQAIPARGYPVADLVAASSATPGVFAPVQLAGMTLVDGLCTGSTTHVDLADDANRLIVVAPVAHAGLVGGQRAIDRLLTEIDRWRARNPGARVDVFTPDDELVELVNARTDSPMLCMDLAVEAERHGRRQAEAQVRSWSYAA